MKEDIIFKNFSVPKSYNSASLPAANNHTTNSSTNKKKGGVEDKFIPKKDKKAIFEKFAGRFYDNINERILSNTIIDSLTTLSALGIGNFLKKITTLTSCFSSENKKLKTLSIAAPMAAALAIRPLLNLINNITLDKNSKKENKYKSPFASGLANAASALMISANPIFAPIGFTLNSIVSYICCNGKPTIKDFVDSHKNSFVVDILAFSAILFCGFKGKVQIEYLNSAINKAKENIKSPILYKMPKDTLTEFQSLARDLGFDFGVLFDKNGSLDLKQINTIDDELLGILLEKGQEGNIEGKMRKIEEMNIFLPKYYQTVIDIPAEQQESIVKQIDAILKGRDQRLNGQKDFDNYITTYYLDQKLDELDSKGLSIAGFKDYQAIIQKIKSDCPTSRTIIEAQEMIDEIFGKGKYTINLEAKNHGLLGVGSIAESYLGRDKNNNEVVIKLIKEHFRNTNKVEQDKQKLLDKIEDRTKEFHFSFSPDKYTIKNKEQKQYDINQVENMCKVWNLETDLTQEAVSANQIKAQASKYKAINAIEAKDGAFIMEKAQGCQLDSKDIAQNWQSAGLNEEDFSNFVDNYIAAYCEQLFSLPKTGEKVVQSDPHGGNILVDLKNIKLLQNKNNTNSPITIIDYGNTTKTKRLDAAKNLFNHIDYLVGNTDSIAKNLLEGAQIGSLNKKQVIEELSKGLKKDIFNCDTKIDVNNPVEIFRIVNSYCLNFMRDKHIIPNASNINQMKAEETYIISNLGCLKRIADGCGYDLGKVIDKKKIIKQLMAEMTKSTMSSLKTNPIFTIKQLNQRVKFIMKNPQEAFSCLGANFQILE